MIEPISRMNAKEQNLKRYFTGCPCPQGHISERYVSTMACIRCVWNKSKAKRKPGGKLRAREMERKRPSIRRWGKESNSQSAINYRIARALRRRLWVSLRISSKVGSAVRDLGCSIAEFRDYIAKQFTQGMSWDNHGEWELDHKKPLAAFDLTNRNQLLLAVHYTNIQPLWAAENQAKGAKCL